MRQLRGTERKFFCAISYHQVGSRSVQHKKQCLVGDVSNPNRSCATGSAFWAVR